MRTIDKIITPVNLSRGAPMGRVGTIPDEPHTVIDIGAPHKFLVFGDLNKNSKRVFDCAVPMSEPGYDKHGAYWGIGKQLRVQYTKDLSYVFFYRKD